MNERTVRPAGPADVVALVDLRRLMYEAWETPGVERPAWQKGAGAWFRQAVELDDVLVVVADLDGEVVASAMGELRRGCPRPSLPTGVRVEISQVSTAPGRRRQGHARACVEAVLSWAQDAGAGRAELVASDDARGLYEELGFVAGPQPRMHLDLGAR